MSNEKLSALDFGLPQLEDNWFWRVKRVHSNSNNVVVSLMEQRSAAAIVLRYAEVLPHRETICRRAAALLTDEEVSRFVDSIEGEYQ